MPESGIAPPSNNIGGKMAFSKHEKETIKKNGLYLLVTVGLYLLFGDQLAIIVQSLDSINETAANVIVFGGIGFIVWVLIAAKD